MTTTADQITLLLAEFDASRNIARAARAAGVSRGTARKLLRARGLTGDGPGRPRRTEYPPDLGKLPDTELAAREGVTRQRVVQWRQEQDPPVPVFKG